MIPAYYTFLVCVAVLTAVIILSLDDGPPGPPSYPS